MSTSKGYLCIFVDNVPPAMLEMLERIPKLWNQNQQTRDSGYHMTILTSEELKANRDDLSDISQNYNIVGLVIKKDIAFLVCNYPDGDKLRLRLGLPEKDFHITIGFSSSDNHNVSKSVRSIQRKSDLVLDNIEAILSNCTTVGKRKELLEKLAELVPDDNHILKSLAQFQANKGYTAEAATTIERIIENSISTDSIVNAVHALLKLPLVHNAEHLWKYLDGQILADRDDSKLLTVLQWFNKNRDSKSYYTVGLDNKLHHYLCPKNFSRIDKKLYASGIVNSSHLPLLQALGIQCIISLTEDVRTSLKDKIKYHHFPIVDRNIPDKDTLNTIIDTICNNDIALVHCLGGKGRTAVAYYGYLIRESHMDMDKIHTQYKDQRCTMLTEIQEQFLRQYQDNPYSCNIRNILYNGKRKPKMIMIVGLPGSGKSTLSQHLVKCLESSVIRINQDDLGRKECFEAMMDNSKNDKLILLDRCNLTVRERKEWSSLCHGSCWCLFLDIDIDECVYRARSRVNHPTLKPTSSRRIITEMKDLIEVPTVKEDFQEVITCTSANDINCILSSWKLPPIHIEVDTTLIKFPRTRHLYNLGSASRDDLLLSSTEIKEYLNRDIYIEEKIDGANVGISIDPDTLEIILQNRSHYISKEDHSQFSKIEHWVQTHSDDLHEILTPGIHILYGEWMHHKHSINYTHLPSYFIAFDIYDRELRRFYGREKLEKILSGVSIPITHLIVKAQFQNVKEIVTYAHSKSHYYDGTVEGIYIRTMSDCGQWLENRCKIVRSDFLQGRTGADGNLIHWSKSIPILNKLLY